MVTSLHLKLLYVIGLLQIKHRTWTRSLDPAVPGIEEHKYVFGYVCTDLSVLTNTDGVKEHQQTWRLPLKPVMY